jgi:hypothetical protein
VSLQDGFNLTCRNQMNAPSDLSPGEASGMLEAGVAPEPVVQASSARRPNRLMRMWRSVGGGSLTLSLLIHVGVLMAAGVMIVVTQIQEKQVDFMPGGGTQQGAKASNELAHKVQQKKRTLLNKTVPMKKIVTNSIDSTLTLPDAPPELLDVPELTSTFGGAALRSGGFGKAGAGGGFGDGVGMGGTSGITFKPIMMFGTELKDARKIAVIMDVSRSMTKFLPIVAKELDKVARGSPLVLYFGCGLKTPPREIDDKVRKVGGVEFDRFWYYWEGRQDMKTLRTEYKNLKFQPGQPMPMEPIYQQMVKRPNTYFIDFNGIAYTSPALMCKEVMEADSLYWFSDFQDQVDVKHIEEVLKKLKSRKQKLFIHASIHGRSFEVVRDKLVVPLGGEVIEAEAK